MQSETKAALVNALIVLLVPPIALVILNNVTSDSDVSMTVFAPGVVRYFRALRTFGRIMRVLLPLGALAYWRTWVYARRRLEQHDSGWSGVLEAGACALAVELALAVPGFARHPGNLSLLMLVSAIALALGLCVGLVLRKTALLVLKFTTRRELL